MRNITTFKIYSDSVVLLGSEESSITLTVCSAAPCGSEKLLVRLSSLDSVSDDEPLVNAEKSSPEIEEVSIGEEVELEISLLSSDFSDLPSTAMESLSPLTVSMGNGVEEPNSPPKTGKPLPNPSKPLPAIGK